MLTCQPLNPHLQLSQYSDKLQIIGWAGQQGTLSMYVCVYICMYTYIYKFMTCTFVCMHIHSYASL